MIMLKQKSPYVYETLVCLQSLVLEKKLEATTIKI